MSKPMVESQGSNVLAGFSGVAGRRLGPACIILLGTDDWRISIGRSGDCISLCGVRRFHCCLKGTVVW